MISGSSCETTLGSEPHQGLEVRCSSRGSVHGNTAAVHPDERELAPGARKAVEEWVAARDDQEKDDEDSKRHQVSLGVLLSLPGPLPMSIELTAGRPWGGNPAGS